jgi:hypothetical protein
MNAPLKRFALPALRWVLGLVVVAQSLEFIFSASTARHLAHMGLPLWLRPVLGGIEVAAAVLFLIPRSAVLGGYLLLTIFAFAIAIHVLHGQYAVDTLIVYFMAVLACLADREQGSAS